jgi:hypothetical protein
MYFVPEGQRDCSQALRAINLSLQDKSHSPFTEKRLFGLTLGKPSAKFSYPFGFGAEPSGRVTGSKRLDIRLTA